MQDKRIEEADLVHFEVPDKNIITPSVEDIEYIKRCFESADRPVVLIGDGIKSADAKDLFSEFIERNDIPVLYSPSAVDTYPSSKELSIGCVSSLGGSREANFCVQNSDFLFVLGCRMPSMVTGGDYDRFAHSAKRVVVDIDVNEPKKGNIQYNKIVHADIKEVLKELNKLSIKRTCDEWVKKCQHWKKELSLTNDNYEDALPVNLYNLAGKFSSSLKDNSVVITDAGFEELIIPSNVHFNETHKCIHPFMQGSMGFALPAVVGTAVGSESKLPVSAVIGDGSIMMNLQELQTIAFNKIPAKIIVVNNNVYAVIRKRQKDLFRTRTVGTDPSNGVNTPEWKNVADCFGFNYLKIENNGELDSGLEKLLNMEGAVLCEVIAATEQTYLHTSIARNEKGAFERRPMEDQAPFLDREVFEKEMLREAKL